MAVDGVAFRTKTDTDAVLVATLGQLDATRDATLERNVWQSGQWLFEVIIVDRHDNEEGISNPMVYRGGNWSGKQQCDGTGYQGRVRDTAGNKAHLSKCAVHRVADRRNTLPKLHNILASKRLTQRRDIA